MVLFGADRVAEFENLFTGRVALLTGPSGRTSGNVPTIDVLKQCCNLQLLLAPEHGVRGDKAAGALFADEIDESSGLPVRAANAQAACAFCAPAMPLAAITAPLFWLSCVICSNGL